MTSSAPFGLLLDVDGPLASTVTRSLRVESIATDLVAIANAGCPVVFNTGRSIKSLNRGVIAALLQNGLAHDAPVWGVGEKGVTWFSVVSGQITSIGTDHDYAIPQDLAASLRAVAAAHSDTMFWDDTKRTMATLEQNIDLADSVYRERQPHVVGELSRTIHTAGEAERFKVDPTAIAIDVEHRSAGKALGAKRAVELVSERMPIPRRWYSAGDSCSDYDMATWLHDAGFDATHLDVGPGHGYPSMKYAVLRERPSVSLGVAGDDITASHLARWRAELRQYNRGL